MRDPEQIVFKGVHGHRKKELRVHPILEKIQKNYILLILSTLFFTSRIKFIYVSPVDTTYAYERPIIYKIMYAKTYEDIYT